MIADTRVLDDERVPDRELVAVRGDRLEDLLEEYQLAQGSPSRNLFLTGPTGTGKTMLTRLSLEMLREGTDHRTAYIDCWQDYDASSIIYGAADQLLDDPIHPDTTSRKHAQIKLRRQTDHHRHLVLDEADQIEDPDVLRDLHSCENLQLIMIAHNEEDLWGTVPDHIQSRVGAGPMVQLPEYSTAQLTDILSERVDHGLRPGKIDDRQLERIAAAAAGDARIAIATLRAAVESADADPDARDVRDGHIQTAIPQATNEIHERSLSRLNDDQEVLYDIVCEHAPIPPGELYDRYRERVDDPRVKRTLRGYMRKLEQYRVVDSRGDGKAKRYHPGNAETDV